ncbi:AtuA-related protein [Paludibaculum fermentans]|uniref:AtuA-related protein n=1 Tax=Paludibaculum fermentans TaxID=1473598 RepID=UPI003EBB1D3A
MPRVRLLELAHARSGDKGDCTNIGLIALRPELYPLLAAQVTAERVKQHFRELCRGSVERYELPRLRALNFVLRESLDGGGTVSLRTDAQGKTYSAALLRMEIDVP